MLNINKMLLGALGVGLLASHVAQAQLAVGTTSAPTSTLQVAGSLAANYTSITAATYTLTATDFYVVYTGTLAASFTLPSGIGIKGRLYTIKNTAASQTLTISAASGESVDGTASFVVPAGQSVQLVTTGAMGSSSATYEVVSFAAATSAGAGAGIGDNLGNHTATQNLNLQGSALVGTGADLGSTSGLGVRADGGLNIGQNTTGNNIFLGYQSGQANTTGTQNVFSGAYSGRANTTGTQNVFSGTYSGLVNTTGNNNTFAGYQSGQANTTGSNNTFTGYQSGQANTTGTQNVFSGAYSGKANTTGIQNTFTGYQSGQANTTGNYNAFTGFQSGYANTTGAQNVFSGTYSGRANTTGIQNTFAGYQSGQANTTGSYNAFTGFQSGYANTTGSYNVFSGAYSGIATTTGSQNTFTGHQSGQANTTGINNTFSGFQSGYANTTGNFNVFSGYQSGQANTTATQNTFTGYQSGLVNTTGSSNMLTGFQSGYANTTGNYNAFSGFQSGYANTTGSNNVFNGTLSGYNNTTGSSNLALGYSAGPSNGALTNATAIGANAYVSSNNSLVLGSINGTNGATASTYVGIGTTSPAYPLDVQGTSGTRSGNYGYLDSNGTVGTNTTGTGSGIVINAAGRIAGTEFDAFSDVRLKTVGGLSDSRADLATVRKIEITNYRMKDKVQYGDRAYKKVIAQQVEQIYPQAINKSAGFIPSIYATGTLQPGAAGQTLVSVPAAHHLKVGDRVRLIGKANSKLDVTVLALGSEKAFAVILPQPETTLFVFGPEVADLRTVDYEALAMLNVSATQELAKQLAALQVQHARLKAALADKTLASSLEELQQDLHALRAEVQHLKAAGTTASTQ